MSQAHASDDAHHRDDDHDEHGDVGARDRAPLATSFTTAVPEPRASSAAGAVSASDLGLVRQTRRSPQNAWRRSLHRATGEYAVDSGERASTDRRTGPARGTRSIAVLSLKGGVGKTTATVGLGATFASRRGDRVVAVDANPDFGTLAYRGPNTSPSTVRTLLADDVLDRYTDIRRHTSQSSSRLEFLGSERDPAASEAFSETDYRAVHRILDRFYNVILTDCGTGLTHSAIAGVLDTADAVVVVGSPSIDSARSALATLEWLSHHGYGQLASKAIVVLNSTWTDTAPVDATRLARHFETRVGSVFVVPFDDHLAEGGEISLDAMHRRTRQAYAAAAEWLADHTS